LGVVYGADRFTIAADLYDIEVLDAIGPLPALAIYQQCFNADGVSNPTYSINDPGGYCSLITRQPGSGLRLAVDSPYRNLGLIKTTGLDIQFNWNGDIRENAIFVNSQLNYVDSFETQDTPLSPIVENAGTLAQGGQYEWRFLTTVGYSLADLSLGLRWRHLPATESAAFATNPLTATLGVDAYDTFDFFGAWEATERVRVRFGIDNLLDEDPEIVDETPGQNNNKGNTLANFYDVLGRRVYVGANWAF
jgi:outer membrane receptor protein involved in Fe transport